MSTTLTAGRYTGSPRPHLGFISYIRSKWQEHQLMRTMESVPYAVMKDVGFPAAERANEM